jgi:hypothetical protein
MKARGAVKMKQAIGVTVVVDMAEVESGREDHSNRCTDGGAGAGERTSLDGCLKEVDDLGGEELMEAERTSDVRPKEVDAFEEKQPGARLMRQAERIKEVAHKSAERVEAVHAAAGSSLQIRELKEVATESGFSGDKHIAGPVSGS